MMRAFRAAHLDLDHELMDALRKTKAPIVPA
jgi:hypothetical protein